MRLLLLFLLFSLPAFAQEKDSLTGPVNVVDGVYIPYYNSCKYDTTVRLHQNADFVIADSNFYTYRFNPGTKTYLEISIQSRECRCRDCESSDQLIIDISNMSDSGEMALSPENLTWFTWNSWIRPKTEPMISGTLTLKGDAVSLQAFSYYDSLRRAVRNDIQLQMPIDRTP